MALAYLAYKGRSGGNVQFDADTGTNDYFQVRVGKSRRTYGGIPIVDEEHFVSPIVRREGGNDVYGTRFVLPVPEETFAGRNRYVQLWTYARPDRTGVAVSDIVQVLVPAESGAELTGPVAPIQLSTGPLTEARPMRYSKASYHEEGISESMFWSQLLGALPQIVDKVVPVVKGLFGGGGQSGTASGGSASGGSTGSSSAGANDLAQAIAGLIQQITRVTGSGTQGGTSPGGSAGASGGASGASGGASGASGGASGASSGTSGGAGGSTPVATASSATPIMNGHNGHTNGSSGRAMGSSRHLALARGNRTGSGRLSMGNGMASGAIGRTSMRLARPLSGMSRSYPGFGQPISGASRSAGTSNRPAAMMEPMPVEMAQMASQCISKDTMEILQDNPRQMAMVLNDSVLRLGGRPRVRYDFAEAKFAWAPLIAAVAPYVKDILEIGNKADADQRRHLEKLVELLDDPSLTALMATLSKPPAPPKFTPDPRMYIDTDALPRLQLRQKDRVVYRRGSALRIPFRLATDRSDAPDRPIPRAIVQATIQDADTMAILWEKEFRVRDVALNSEVRVVEILPEESRNLPANVDLKLEMSVRWPGKDRRGAFGTIKNQFITLVDDLIFDQLGEKQGETLLLNDVARHRAYWHKVWEGGYSDSRRWNLEFDAKYFYAVDVDDDDPARLETRVLGTEDNAESDAEMPDRRRVRARLKSGMELTLGMLADLLPENGAEAPTSEHLQALRHPDFGKYLNQVARAHLELKGRSGDTATLWVYPEVDIHKIHLLRVSQTNDDGQVLGMTKESILFPRPSSIHFIGTQSE